MRAVPLCPFPVFFLLIGCFFFAKLLRIMTFLGILYNIIIAPSETVIETVFCFTRVKFEAFGIMGAIVAVSLVVNFLALPLYNIADKLQLEERETQRRLSRWVKHIKKHFSGDEQFMMLSTYYRENSYHPLYALRSSLSIMIEIPFFIAAYHFLSHSTSLSGASFWLLEDLGQPDTLVRFGGSAVHLLPVIMTVINLVSGAVYTKGAPLKEKIQLYAMTLLFLVLLYNSPSGLVCYWILNNLFSLIKNIINAHVKRPGRFVHAVLSGLMLCAAFYLLLRGGNHSLVKRGIFFVFAAFVAVMPRLFSLLKPHLPSHAALSLTGKALLELLVSSGAGLALLCGFLLPLSVIATSPAEFSFIGNTPSPLTYIWNALSICAGFFLFWPLCISRLFGRKLRSVLALLFPFLFLAALANAYVFKQRYGLMSVFFKLNDASGLKDYSPFFSLLPLLAYVVACVLVYALLRHRRGAGYLSLVMLAFCIAELVTGTGKVRDVSFGYGKTAETRKFSDSNESGFEPVYNLSRTEKNVLVLFMDRAISSFFPCIFEQFPQFKDQYKGFVFYPNTVSFSNQTAKASPAMMGGYEYTPENENKRPDELLKDKHNEAQLVLPRLFLDAGYDVTVTDPPLANYAVWHSDSTAFMPYPEIHLDFVWGKYSFRYQRDHLGQFTYNADTAVGERCLCFAFMQVLPPVLRNTFYQGGEYFREVTKLLGEDALLNNYTALYYLPELTSFESTKPTYTFICNDLPHVSYQLLAGDDYHPELEVDESNASGTGNFKWKLSAFDTGDREAYHVNAATLLLLGKWFTFLQENGVYDNTRIIIVADHGYNIYTPAFGQMENGTDYARYNPLLMVKDFNASGELVTDNSFMTNADTLFFATEGLPVSDRNPFTQKKFEDMRNKQEVHIYPTEMPADFFAPDFNEVNAPAHLTDKTTWMLKDVTSDTCWSVHDNIFDESNWTRIGGKE